MRHLKVDQNGDIPSRNTENDGCLQADIRSRAVGGTVHGSATLLHTSSRGGESRNQGLHESTQQKTICYIH